MNVSCQESPISVLKLALKTDVVLVRNTRIIMSSAIDINRRGTVVKAWLITYLQLDATNIVSVMITMRDVFTGL